MTNRIKLKAYNNPYDIQRLIYDREAKKKSKKA